MRLGVDYYPEHWDEERWPVDARLMRAAGITVVRLAEFSWCRLEPHEGEFSFAWLDRALEALQREGIEAVLGTPTAAPPAWLHERYPDIYPTDARGYRLGFGTRHQRCPNSDVMRKYARRMVEAMAAHYGKHPSVIGWQIDNELEANLCYCATCADKFRDWLAGKYTDLRGLNETWGTTFWSQEYTGWSQIPLPWESRQGRSHNPALLLDYRRFASESTVSFHREQVEIVRRLAPGHFITHNLMGLHSTLDYYQLARDLDFVAWDNYPLGFWGPDARHAGLAHEVMHGIKQRGFWVMESQSGISAWEMMGRRPADGQMRAWAWQAVGHGAEAVLFFRWRSCLFGTEQLWQGLLNHDGQPRRRYEEAARLGKDFLELSPVLDGSVHGNPVAVLNSYEQNWALQIQPQVEGLDWWTQTGRYFDSLSRLGLCADVVPIGAQLDQYRLVIAPSWFVVTETDAERLGEFVRAGGVLVLSPRTGVKDRHNNCHPQPLPSLLRGLAGLEIDDYDPLGAAVGRVTLGEGQDYAISVWADALRLQGAEAIGFYGGDTVFAGEPAVARHRFGRGVAYYLGTFGEPAFYDALLGRILPEVGLTGLSGMPSGVDASWRRKDGVDYLFLVNLSGRIETAPAPEGARAILGPEPGGGGSVTLPPHEVGIYRVPRECSTPASPG